MISLTKKNVEKQEWYLKYVEEIIKLLKEIEEGLHPEGIKKFNESFSMNIFSYQSDEEVNRNWEVHKNHIDIHVLLKGQEMIGFSDDYQWNEKHYDVENDSLSFESEIISKQLLNEKDWLIIFPNEGHKTGLSIDSPTEIKKAVFKIKVGGKNE